MSIGTPSVNVCCDRCGQYEDIELTPLARGWSMDNVRRKLDQWGWRQTLDGDDICDDCAHEEKAASTASEGRT